MAKKKRKKKQKVLKGTAYVYSNFNNTIITITDKEGNVLTWKSSGTAGFEGTKKGTPFAAQLAAEQAAKEASEVFGMESLNVKVKGPGSGRESSIRALEGVGMDITSIQDVTPIPHNGCRPPKKRRV
ncbi:MAG: 30S ribosomal protein S11 [Fusobacteriota bacterium]